MAQELQQINPEAVLLELLARLLSQYAPRPVTVGMLRDDTNNGAPTNADGTMNLDAYEAWLVRQLREQEGALSAPAASQDASAAPRG